MSVIERIDSFQRAHPRAGLPIAVVYKFFDDQGTYLAALITFYGLLSLIPLLLLSSTILGFVLEGHPSWQADLLTSAFGQYPVIGDSLRDQDVSGSGIGLVVGIVGVLYGGLGVAQAAQNAMNTIWRVPRNERPNPFKGRARSIVLLLVVGSSVIGTTALTALGIKLDAFGVYSKIAIVLGTFALNGAVFTLAFRLATARPLTLRQTVPGAVGAAAIWQLLQYVGTLYVGSVIRHAKEVDGVFATVLGLMAWIYIEALVVVLAVEFNTVRSLRLYPRALLTPFTDDVVLTPADQVSYAQQAKAMQAKGFEQITVRFDPPDD